MDTRKTRRAYVRPELVALGRLEVETRGDGGDRFEIEMPREISL